MKPSDVAAVIPLRDLHTGKTRLRSALTDTQRHHVIRGLARHVITTLMHTPELRHITIVTAEPPSVQHFITSLPQPPEPVLISVIEQQPTASTLNGALHQVRQTLDPFDTSRCLVVAADLPHLTVSDIQELLHQPTMITLAADHSGYGTNAHLSTMALPLQYRFGPGSLQRHLDDATPLGWSTAVIAPRGLSHDVDTPQDWMALPDSTQSRLLSG